MTKALENKIDQLLQVVAMQQEQVQSLTEKVSNMGIQASAKPKKADPVKVSEISFKPELIDRDVLVGDHETSNVYFFTSVDEVIKLAKDCEKRGETPVFIASIANNCYQSYDRKVDPPKPVGYPALKDHKFFHTATSHGYVSLPVIVEGEKMDFTCSLSAQLRPAKIEAKVIGKEI